MHPNRVLELLGAATIGLALGGVAMVMRRRGAEPPEPAREGSAVEPTAEYGRALPPPAAD